MSISVLRRKRGVASASITRLSTRLTTLEGKIEDPTTLSLARQASNKLDTLDKEFQALHYSLLEVIPDDDDETLTKEQEVLDNHDENVANLAARVERLITACTQSPEPDAKRAPTRRLSQLENSITATQESVNALTPEAAVHILHQYQEQLTDYKSELSSVRSTLLSLDLPEENDLDRNLTKLEKQVFNTGISLKKVLYSSSTHVPDVAPTIGESAEGKGVKLPKLDVPTFDGNILGWQTFWEQFSVAVHERKDISNAEKLVYLRSSVKDGSAKNVIEGLSRSGEQYDEAVKCLQARYDRPRLIHQTHVRKILDIPAVRDGSGKELRPLHDVAQQHLRALKSMKHDPSGAFITSLLELKLDPNTMFEWQKASQKSTDVPPYEELLQFINLRAQASESITPESKPRFFSKKYSQPGRTIPANAAGVTGSDLCLCCKTEKHPLYSCTQFKTLSHDKMLSILKSNGLCMNCLKAGHFAKHCQSLNRCRKCQRNHHTVLHLESKFQEPPSSNSTGSGTVIIHNSHVVAGISTNALLMTFQVLVQAPDGATVKA